jgi:hypothetical protein
MPANSSAFPDLPDIFGSDEPIQTGLLERLLAEDPSWRRDGDEPEPLSTSEPPEPSSSSDSSAPGRPFA